MSRRHNGPSELSSLVTTCYPQMGGSLPPQTPSTSLVCATNFRAETADVTATPGRTQSGSISVTDERQQAAPRPRKATNKRGRYVSNACLSCQRRKVKCSGERTCLQCCVAEQECFYTDDRRRRGGGPRRPSTNTGRQAPSPRSDHANGGGDQQALVSTLMQLMHRITTLEREQTLRTSRDSANTHDGDDASSDGEYGTSDVEDAYESTIPGLPQGDGAHAKTSGLNG